MTDALTDWMTSREIADRFGITTAAVRMAIRAGRVPPEDLTTKGGLRLIRRTTAEALWKRKEN